jgi:transposase
MGEYSEAFVAFDVSKTKHAVAIADGGRGGEVRFVGEVANSTLAVERLRKRSMRSPMPISACAGWSSSSR